MDRSDNACACAQQLVEQHNADHIVCPCVSIFQTSRTLARLCRRGGKDPFPPHGDRTRACSWTKRRVCMPPSTAFGPKRSYFNCLIIRCVTAPVREPSTELRGCRAARCTRLRVLVIPVHASKPMPRNAHERGCNARRRILPAIPSSHGRRGMCRACRSFFGGGHMRANAIKRFVCYP